MVGLFGYMMVDNGNILNIYGGFHKKGVPPIAGWFISWKILENLLSINGCFLFQGTPMDWKPPNDSYGAQYGEDPPPRVTY